MSECEYCGFDDRNCICDADDADWAANPWPEDCCRECSRSLPYCDCWEAEADAERAANEGGYEG